MGIKLAKDKLNNLSESQIFKERRFKRSWIGMIILLFGLIFPKFLEGNIFIVLDDLYSSISHQDSGLLLIASAKLVLLNTIRHVPIYTGTFIMAEGFYSLYKIHQLGFIIPIILIPLAYKAISLIYGIAFVFAGPAYLTVLAIIILHLTTLKIKPISIKVVIITIFLFGLDWLDIVPMLSKYGFGKGEIAASIKQVTEFIEANYIMNFVGLIFAITIISNALVLSKVVVDYFNKLALIEESRFQEERLRRLEIEAIKSRYIKEVKHLVHDLKTPLVTIQGLSEVIYIKSSDVKLKEYGKKICKSAEEMASMISEILYHNKKNIISIKELFNYIRIQLPPHITDNLVQFKVGCNNLRIVANKIRVSRAIINLVENALKAVDPVTGSIQVFADKEEDKVTILVKDNGIGIEQDKLDQVWKVGYTTGLDNIGLGLNFVKQVVNSHQGEIKLESIKNIGTEVKMYFPEVKDEYDKDLSC